MPAGGQEGVGVSTEPGLPTGLQLTFSALCFSALQQLGILFLVLGVGLLCALLLHTATGLLQEGHPGHPLPWQLGVFRLGLLGLTAFPVRPGEGES